MKTKYIALSKLLKQGTQGPFVTVHGKGTCFHDGNRDSIQKIGTDGGEMTSETVCEFWPAVPSRISKADALLYNHFRNRGEAMVKILECVLRRAKVALQDVSGGDAGLALGELSFIKDEVEAELLLSKRVELPKES